MQEKIVIYPAAALFNARETYFNSCLVEDLEKEGYRTNFPQRDGFEFGSLTNALSEKLQPDQISSAVQNIIYFLDMGVFVPKSDLVLANFDEPLDEGVVVEASYAKLMGKFVIGLRTDIRSPYGSLRDSYGGMHFFPAYQSHKFIFHHMPSKVPKEREQQMTSLVQKIHQTIQMMGLSHQEEIPEYVIQNPNMYQKVFEFHHALKGVVCVDFWMLEMFHALKCVVCQTFRHQIIEGANLLFKGIDNIHSKIGIKEIASRYTKSKKRLEGIGQKIALFCSCP